jgi:hypothetical protein
MTPNTLSETLSVQYRYTDFTFMASLKGLSEEDAFSIG